MAKLLNVDFDLVCDLSSQKRYDYVIVGSGLAGGILANALVEKNKRVLLIEKGGLLFSTHCLNTSRPHWQIGGTNGPSQDNDVVFNAVKEKVEIAAGSDPYVGGPVYCLGGRSTVWGLYIPRVLKYKLDEFYPQSIAEYLDSEGYRRAFELLTDRSQETAVYPQSQIPEEVNEAMERLQRALRDFYHASSSRRFHIQLAALAAEFNAPAPYRLPQGAYSTVDALLDKVYSKNEMLTILTNCEVLWCELDSEFSSCKSIKVRDNSTGKFGQIVISNRLILSAGAIGTAKIALNSGLGSRNSLIGRGLTDHQIWGVRLIRELEPSDTLYDPVKLQSYKKMCGHSDVLLNVVVNANSFLGRGTLSAPATQFIDKRGQLLAEPPEWWRRPCSEHPKYDTINITMEFEATLDDNNRVLDIPSEKPVVYVKQTTERQDENSQEEMQRLVTAIRNAFCKVNDTNCPGPRPSLAGFGVVAHEVGTMRMKSGCDDGVVDENFLLVGTSNLHVCDLSILPVSSPANPSLTLAALALRLADNLMEN